ncbi:hypothetical protein BDV25DRAFT_138058 [Aspergillus avenaceus]|uniref:Hypervirulence associated protein TUDOR domain-containing protein n=1 Tax=Aspergillus avenaceus TaxID=36643 RepID=A0A5N6U0U8_ASPAV|nr:hypothetical protein BDV25DRAFT_138058 [Aspergillus avenaceus]
MTQQDKYTDPDLREEIKEEIKQSDKGGKPGQWSARKAQFTAAEYKKRGGDYTTSKEEGEGRDESQRSLEKWGEEEWQTKEGSGTARMEDGSRKRYLPARAWEKMSEREREETDKKKKDESREGKQFVGNTEVAKKKRKEVQGEDGGESEDVNVDGKEGEGEDENDQDEELQDGEAEDQDKEQGDEDGEGAEPGKKRTAKQKETPNKKPRTRQDSKAEREQGEQAQ